MTGYVRKDTTNNIADGNVINAADLDAEFDGIQDAFNASTGHNHDGTSGEGAPITALGPTQDVTISATLLAPKTTNTVDIGSSALKFKDLFLAGNGSIGGTLAVTGVATLGAGAILNTPASVTLTNATGLPISTGVSGLGTGVATALAVNVGSAGAPVVNGGALGTPSSGTVTNLTGTASININGTVGATTASTGAFTTLSASSTVTLSGGTANGVAYLNASKVLTTGSALAFDGSNVTANGSFTSGTTGVAGSFILARSSDGAGTTVLESLAATNNIGLRNTVGSIIFSANNSEGMRLTSTGLGIGTSSPAVKLDVAGAVGFGRFTSTTGTNHSGIEVKNGSSYLDFAIDNSTGSQYGFGAYGRGIYSDGAYPFIFNVNGANRLTLDSSGNLGLGVTPSAWGGSRIALEMGSGSLIYPATNAVFQLAQNAYYGSSGWTYKATTNASIYSQDTGKHIWYTAASGTAGNAITFTQAMTLDSSGNLLVGTTSAFSPLTVNGSNRFDTVTFGDIGTPANNAGIYLRGTGANGISWASGGYLAFFGGGVGSTERMRLDASGNLGLGVTPSAWGTASGRKAIEVGSTGNGLYGYSQSNFNMSAGAYFNGTNWIYTGTEKPSYYNQSVGAHSWYTAGTGTAGNAITFTQAMSLTAGGNLVLGATDSDFRLSSIVQSGADRDVFQAAILGASNGFRIKWNHATSTIRINISNLPTSATGLTSGDLWNDGGTLKIA